MVGAVACFTFSDNQISVNKGKILKNNFASTVLMSTTLIKTQIKTSYDLDVFISIVAISYTFNWLFLY